MQLLSILLTVLFIGLKLSNFIDWSWWLVISPLIFYFSLYMFFVFLFLAIAAFVQNVKLNIKKRKQ